MVLSKQNQRTYRSNFFYCRNKRTWRSTCIFSNKGNAKHLYSIALPTLKNQKSRHHLHRHTPRICSNRLTKFKQALPYANEKRKSRKTYNQRLKTQKTNPNHRLEIPLSSNSLANDTLLHLGKNKRKKLAIKKTP